MRNDRSRPSLDVFEGLVYAHVGAAYRVAAALVGQARAPELVRAAVLVAWRRLPPGVDGERFAPWLLRIVVATGRSALHRRGSVREIPAAGSALQAAFADLGYDQRALIALHHAARLPPHEVALTLEVRDGIARQRLGAAVRALGRQAGLPEQRWPGRDDALHPDVRVETFLASLGEVPVPWDLAASAAEHVRANPRRPPSPRLVALAGAAGILAVVAAAVASGLDLPFDLSPGPPAAPTTFLGTYRRTGTVEFAEILRTGAPVSSEPGEAGVIRQTTLEDVGLRVLVIARQLVGDRPWVKVELERPGEEAAFVWVPQGVSADGSGGYDLPVLGGAEPGCPELDGPSAGLLVGLTQAERLACIGDDTFTIGPAWVRAIGPAGNDGTPGWLAGPPTRVLATDPPAGRRFDIGPLRVDPAAGLDVPTGTSLRVELHLDDRAAVNCARTQVDAMTPVGNPADQVLWCRQQLVLTAFTPAGNPSASGE